jgi:hypothetical protein
MAKRSQGWVKCEDRLPYYKDSSCSLPLATTPRPRPHDPRGPRGFDSGFWAGRRPWCMRTAPGAPPPRSGRPASTGEQVGCDRGGGFVQSAGMRAGSFVFFWILRTATNCFWSGESRGNYVPFIPLFTRSSSFLLVSRLSRSGVCSAFIADRHEEILTATRSTTDKDDVTQLPC